MGNGEMENEKRTGCIISMKAACALGSRRACVRRSTGTCDLIDGRCGLQNRLIDYSD